MSFFNIRQDYWAHFLHRCAKMKNKTIFGIRILPPFGTSNRFFGHFDRLTSRSNNTFFQPIFTRFLTVSELSRLRYGYTTTLWWLGYPVWHLCTHWDPGRGPWDTLNWDIFGQKGSEIGKYDQKHIVLKKNMEFPRFDH